MAKLTPKKFENQAILIKIEYLEKMLKYNSSQLEINFKNILNYKNLEPLTVALSVKSATQLLANFTEILKEYNDLKKVRYTK
jgi:hypothetical protein